MASFDYVIVGGGSAGCVLASRLSEDPDVTVCLLEAGPAKQDWSVRVPAGLIKTMKDPNSNWLLRTAPQKNLDNRELFWPRGKVMGGSSAINGMVYIRGHRDDYDRWASDEGCAGWDWQTVLPYFRRSEHNERLTDDLHGIGGPLNVADPRSPNPMSRMYVESCAAQQTPRTRTSTATGRRAPASTSSPRRTAAAAAPITPIWRAWNGPIWRSSTWPMPTGC